MRRRLTLILLAVLSLIQIAGCSRSSSKNSIPDLLTPVKKQTSTITVKAATFENSIVAYTAVSYSDFYNISFPGGKRVFLRKYCYVGKYVSQGELLAEADYFDTQEQINTLSLQLAKARIDLQELVDSMSDAFVIEQQQLQVNNLEVQLRALQRALDSCRIYSPVSGTVVYVDETVKAGDTLNSNQTIIKIVDRSRATIELNLGDQSALFKDGVFTGQSVKIYANGAAYDATIRMASAGEKTLYANTATARPLFVEPADPNVSLPAGTQVKVVITLSRQENVFTLPTYIIKKVTATAAKGTVRVYTNGKAVDREVTIGESNSFETVILSGLSAGDKVLYK